MGQLVLFEQDRHRGKYAARHEVHEWLVDRGRHPAWKPPEQHSLGYLIWGWVQNLARHQINELLVFQDYKCGYCGKALHRFYDQHHRTYEHLGSEEASDLELLHRRCHQRVHEQLNWERRQGERDVCGCQIA